MDNRIIDLLFNELMSSWYLGIGTVLVTIAFTFKTLNRNKRFSECKPFIIFLALGVFSFVFAFISINNKVIFYNSEKTEFIEVPQTTNEQANVQISTEEVSKSNYTNGATTIIQERNKSKSYDNYEEVKISSDFNQNFTITNSGIVNVSGSHNDNFTITTCESVVIASHNDNYVIKNCKQVEISGSFCDVIIIINCPDVKILDNYNTVYLVNSTLKQNTGDNNQVQQMTIEEFKKSDMGYLIGEN